MKCWPSRNLSCLIFQPWKAYCFHFLSNMTRAIEKMNEVFILFCVLRRFSSWWQHFLLSAKAHYNFVPNKEGSRRRDSLVFPYCCMLAIFWVQSWWLGNTPENQDEPSRKNGHIFDTFSSKTHIFCFSTNTTLVKAIKSKIAKIKRNIQFLPLSNIWQVTWPKSVENSWAITSLVKQMNASIFYFQIVT